MVSRAIKTEPEEVESVHQICRLCMSQESLEDVFTEEGICQWISDYLSITISAEDNMSHSICSICRIRLAEFHQFRVRSQEVQDVLQSTIRSTISTEEMKMDQAIVDQETRHQQISQHLDELLDDHKNEESEELEIREFDQKNHSAKKLKDIKLAPYNKIDSTIGTHEHAVEQMPRNESEQYNSEDSEEEFSVQLKPSSFDLPYNITLDEESMHDESAKGDPSTVIEDIIDIEDVKIERVHDETSEEEQSVDTEDVESGRTQNADSSSSSQTTDKAVPIAIRKPGTLQVQCSICLKEFPNKIRFNAHNYQHIKTILCSICEKPFPNRIKLQNHMPTHLSIQERKLLEKPFKCEICEKSFMNVLLLIGHKKQVHGPKIHQCHICGFKVTRRSTLATHLRMHSQHGDSEQDYQSLQRFKSKEEIAGEDTNCDPSKDSALREKKFKCGECQEAFHNDRGRLRHYKLVHQKKYKCSLCNVAFGNNKFLDRHIIRVHKPKEPKEKRFECDTCSRKFMFRRFLTAHQKQVHGPKSFECHIKYCDSKFTTRYGLKRHLLCIHGLSTEKGTNSKS